MSSTTGISVAVAKKDIVDVIQSTVTKYAHTGELNLPADYSVGNALKAAFLMLQATLTTDKRPVLEACTQVSIHNALYSMVVQGLNPDKKQCYFIAYGNVLTCQRSYFGSMALAKRLDLSISDIPAEIVYQGDTLKYKIVKGRKVISDHEQSFGGDDRPIVGVYAMILDHSGEIVKTELMTIKQVHQSWRQSRQNPFDDKGNVKPGSVHGKFPEDMAKRTVINKICKPIINSSSDSTILGQVLRQDQDDSGRAAFDIEYQENANSTPLIVHEQEIQAGHETIDHGTGEIIGSEAIPIPSSGVVADQPQNNSEPSFAVS